MALKGDKQERNHKGYETQEPDKNRQAQQAACYKLKKIKTNPPPKGQTAHGRQNTRMKQGEQQWE